VTFVASLFKTSCIDDGKSSRFCNTKMGVDQASDAYALSVFPFGREDKKTLRVSTEWVVQ